MYKKSPPSCVYSFPWSSPSWQHSRRLGRVWARRIRIAGSRVRPWDASCNSYKNKHKIVKKKLFVCPWTIRLGCVASTHYIVYIYVCTIDASCRLWRWQFYDGIIVYFFPGWNVFKETLVKLEWVCACVIKEKQKQQNKINKP